MTPAADAPGAATGAPTHARPLRPYLVVITMPDGSQGEHRGEYEDGFAAVMQAKNFFPDARRISALDLGAMNA